MRLFFAICNISAIFFAVSGSFVNPYPRFQHFSDDGDPGEALYLTKYIESGDIKTVRFLLLLLTFFDSCNIRCVYFTNGMAHFQNIPFFLFANDFQIGFNRVEHRLSNMFFLWPAIIQFQLFRETKCENREFGNWIYLKMEKSFVDISSVKVHRIV